MAIPSVAQASQIGDSRPALPHTQSAGFNIRALSNNARIIWGMIAAMSVASIVGYRISELSFDWSGFGTMGACIAVLLAISYCYRRLRPDPWISFGAEGCAQLLLILSLGSILSFPLATVGFPYSDALLNDADKWMGLDWRAYLHFINDRPLLGTSLSFAYSSMAAEAVALILALVVTSRLLRLQQFVLANAVGLTITLAIFTFMPAGGTFSFLQIQPGEFANLSPAVTYDQLIQLDSLRSGQHPSIAEMQGLIAFPSFHTAWAVFFMWAFFPIRRLRVPAILLNLLVIVSTPIQGAHYFIDLIGGAVVAAVAIYVAAVSTRAVGNLPLFSELSCRTAKTDSGKGISSGKSWTD